MPIELKHFYMIRHGQTEANAAQIMAGSTDSPLTTTGISQAQTAQTIVENLTKKPQLIIHSNLSRARDTAYIINKNLNLPIHEDAEVAEWHAGKWEGVPYKDCPKFLDGWQSSPNGEKADDFLDRIRTFKNKTFKKYNQTPLIVSHGGVFRAFGKLYGLESPGVENCTLYEFKPEPSKTQFPWDIWEYSPSNDPMRKQVMIYSAPTSSESKIA